MKFKILGLAFFLIFLLTISLALAQVGPGIPHAFYGTVTFSNGPAISGLTVVAKIDGEVFGNTTTSDGKYGPYLYVRDPYNSNEGKTITFYVDGKKANQEVLFVNGGHTKLDLTIDAPGPTPPTPTTVPLAPTGGGGGGGGGVPVTTTTTTVPKPVCGNDVCEVEETCSSCPEDCGPCPSVRIDIVDIEIPEDVYANTPFEFSIKVKNVGDKRGSDEITLALPKGWKSDAYRKSVTLGQGQSTTLKFSITPDESRGVIAVGSSTDLEKSREITPKKLVKVTEKLPITGMIVSLIESVDWMIVVMVIVIALIVFFAVVKKFKRKRYEKFKYKFKPKKKG